MVPNASSKPRALVSFRIFAPELIPDQITEDLDIQPDHKHLKGDYPRDNPKFRAAKGGMWLLQSKLPDTEVFEDHLDNILSNLEGKADYILNLGKYATLDFYCVLYEQEGFELSASILGRIAKLGAALGVVVYPSNNEVSDSVD